MAKIYLVYEGDNYEEHLVAIFSDKVEAEKCAKSKDDRLWQGRVVEDEIYSSFVDYVRDTEEKH